MSGSPIPIVGGTGALGFGLALRLAAAEQEVIIGSRDAGRAEEAAARVRERVSNAHVAGMENAAAAALGEVVFLTVPFRAQSENLTNLKGTLREGQILVDATVPLAAAVSGKATRLLGVPQGSAAEQAQEMVPDGVTVISALHSVDASTKRAVSSAPAFTGRRPGIRPISSATLSLGSLRSPQTSTSWSSSLPRSLSVEASP